MPWTSIDRPLLSVAVAPLTLASMLIDQDLIRENFFYRASHDWHVLRLWKNVQLFCYTAMFEMCLLFVTGTSSLRPSTHRSRSWGRSASDFACRNTGTKLPGLPMSDRCRGKDWFPRAYLRITTSAAPWFFPLNQLCSNWQLCSSQIGEPKSPELSSSTNFSTQMGHQFGFPTSAVCLQAAPQREALAGGLEEEHWKFLRVATWISDASHDFSIDLSQLHRHDASLGRTRLKKPMLSAYNHDGFVKTVADSYCTTLWYDWYVIS